MASLLIRDLDDDVKERLRVRAANHGRSMEAEARLIIASAVAAQRPVGRLGSYIHAQFAQLGGIELEIAPRNDPPRVPELGE
jgi:plasmid stability protein